MAADKWLEQELAELDEAEQFIQQSMSEFLPTINGNSAKNSQSNDVGKSEVTSSIPKVDKLTSELISGFDTGKQSDSYDSYHLPPPPNLDDFILSTKENKPVKATVPPPPPPVISNPTPPPPKEKKAPPVMSKKAPPPVLPKPSRSTALKGKSSAKESKRELPSIPSNAAPVAKPPPPAAGIPKDIQKNSVEELDFLTNNLLSNMEHYKDEDFYGYCENCGGVVEGEKVGCNALGHTYHIKCFTCITCKMELHGEPFYAVEKSTYCEPCYVASLEVCTVCSEKVVDRILRATGKPFHPECFKCSECGKSLDGIPFTADDSDNIYCVEDYHQKFAPRCSVCELPILPEPGKEETVRIIALDRSFHIKCYKCEKCQVQLSSDKGCYPIDNHIYCLECNTSLTQQAA